MIWAMWHVAIGAHGEVGRRCIVVAWMSGVEFERFCLVLTEWDCRLADDEWCDCGCWTERYTVAIVMDEGFN